MCGRYNASHMTQAEMLEIMERFLDMPGEGRIDEDAPEAVSDSYNVKPTQQVQMLFTHDDGLVATTARWWFVPHWHKGEAKDWKATTFNARMESAPEKPVFRTAWRSGRCVIPAEGYYEWTGPKGRKQPWYITLDSNQPVILFAGLRSVLRDGTRTCTILTRDAAPEIGEIHNRMPVILEPDHLHPWLSGAASDAEVIDSFGAGWEGRFRTHRVRPFGIADDGEDLLIEAGDPLIE